MGRAKPMLGVDDSTFIARVVRVLRAGGCRDVVAVVSPDDDRVGSAAAAEGARVVANPSAGGEQIDSLRLGLRSLQAGARGVVLLPVDHPLVQHETVGALIAAFGRNGAPVVRASHRSRPGHPTLFSAAVFEELLEGELPDGARSVIAAHETAVEDVAVDDEGVLADIDTPDDYRWHLGARVEDA